jgi:GT2 family glycosyltransferase
MVGQLRGMGKNLSVDIFVIEMGSNPKRLSKHCSLYYADKDYRGKCYGHNVGLRYALFKGNYRYYWILMNDLVFNPKADVIGNLVEVADKNPKIGALSPTEPASSYINCKPKRGRDFHLVTTCDYLCLLVRAEAVDKVGFLNPAFKYCWGAIHELSYKLYKNGFWVAYCDKATMKHLGGTTYGKMKNLPSRKVYKRNANRFAARYFVRTYGKNWDKIFSKVLPPMVEVNAFPPHRKGWESALDPKERRALH